MYQPTEQPGLGPPAHRRGGEQERGRDRSKDMANCAGHEHAGWGNA